MANLVSSLLFAVTRTILVATLYKLSVLFATFSVLRRSQSVRIIPILPIERE